MYTLTLFSEENIESPANYKEHILTTVQINCKT